MATLQSGLESRVRIRDTEFGGSARFTPQLHAVTKRPVAGSPPRPPNRSRGGHACATLATLIISAHLGVHPLHQRSGAVAGPIHRGFTQVPVISANSRSSSAPP